METITAYKTHDGELFTNENEAIEHETDLLGEQVDGLYKLFDHNGRLTQVDIFKAVLSAMDKKKQKQLYTYCFNIVSIIESINNMGDEE